MARNVNLTEQIPDDKSETSPAATTIAPLADSKFFGLWRDRTDITDSAEFATNLRRHGWQRSR